MDCDTCDELLLDLLYGELDDARRGTVQHHVDGCAACRGALQRLRRVRQAVARVGPAEAPAPSAALLEAIQTAAREATDGGPRNVTPALEDVSVPRTPAWLRRAGDFAMRRQVAMAAVFLLSIGLGLRLVRPPGGTHPGDAVEVGPTEVIPAQEVAPAAGVGEPSRPQVGRQERADPHRTPPSAPARTHAPTAPRSEAQTAPTPAPQQARQAPSVQGEAPPAWTAPVVNPAPTVVGAAPPLVPSAPANDRLGGTDPTLEQLLPRAPAMNNDPYQVTRPQNPTPPPNTFNRWATLEQQGDEFTSRGQLNQAITAYREALAAGPDEGHRRAITLRLVGVLNRANRGAEARALSASLRPLSNSNNNELLNTLPSPTPSAPVLEAPPPAAPVPSANLPSGSVPRVNSSVPRPSINRAPTMRRSTNNPPMDQSLGL